MMARTLVSFCSVPPPEVQEDIFISSTIVVMENDQDTVRVNKNSGEKPKFGSRPNYGSPGFDFQKELDRLPFPLNLGKVEMSKDNR